MRIVLQRVSQAQVTVADRITGAIEQGLVALVAVAADDDEATCRMMADKLCHLRIFPDEDDLMNRSLIDCGGGVLAISQFTLYAECRKGRRPFFGNAAKGPTAGELFDCFVTCVNELGINCQTGVFGAHMDVSLVNSGPVTIILDSVELSGPRRR